MAITVDDMRGVFPIAFTCFTEDGEIDYDEFEKQVGYLARTGASGVVMYGMTSEYHKLSDAEKEKLTTVFLRKMKEFPNVISVLNVTDWATELAVKTAKKYESLGVDAIMLMPPFYYAPSLDMIRNHIHKVLEAVSIPVMIQYAPLATKLYMDNKELADFCNKYPNACFKAEYRPAVPFMEELFKERADMPILTGWAGLDIVEQVQLGVRGLVTVGGYTEVFVAIFKAIEEGNIEKAKEIYAKLHPYIDIWMVNPESLLAIEKEILYRRGICKNSYCRHPRYLITEENSKQIDEFIKLFF